MGLVCALFSQNAPRGFTAQTVSSVACARTAPPVTGPVENAHAPVAGWEQPVSWVRVTETLSFHSFQPGSEFSSSGALRSGNADVTTVTADTGKTGGEQLSRRQLYHTSGSTGKLYAPRGTSTEGQS